MKCVTGGELVGLASKHRIPNAVGRYLLWSLEKFRAGEDPKNFAHDAKGKKKIRG